MSERPLARIDGPAPEIVFLHEGLGAATMWRGFPDALCAALGQGGILPDRRGHGTAPPFDDPVRGGHRLDYHEREAEALIALLERERIVRPILFGHSDGGTIALLAAALAPDRIAGCVTEAAHVFVEEVTLAGIRDAVTAYEAPDSRLKAALLRHHGAERADKVFYRWADAWLSPPFAAWNMEHRLPEVRCPVLAIQGLDDEYGTPAQVRAIVDQVAGRSEPLLIENSGHAPHLDSQDAVIDAVRTFAAAL
ncbi:alpha/beta fold hydrolase [Thalassobaculum litoreum]|uniref:Pimeloyl-ACP methyl ester carboxylesterase n=1 Tax=Thalassobaculum litoreum DSM 18839 TaxID=1123362 RepID=A0A8G2BK08_9PROT|nr:alpha/beta hydrolase [Thalassobaculum litoreum]SDF92943.1 Pimeloyl-ACP methyl ester carboxylesterase [Thalassobaculum litoreum DSM 18839]